MLEAIELVHEALFLRMNGERAPGETWADWERRAEQLLREYSDSYDVAGGVAGEHETAP